MTAPAAGRPGGVTDVDGTSGAGASGAGVSGAGVSGAGVSGAGATQAAVTEAAVTEAAVTEAAVTEAAVTEAAVTEAAVTRADGVTVLPAPAEHSTASVREALRQLAVLAHDTGRRSWAVLGPVPGADPVEHDGTGRLAVRLNVARLVAVGEDAGAVHAGAVLEGSWGDESVHAPDAAAAAAHLAAALRPGDLVLLAGPGTGTVRDALLEGTS